MMYFSAELSSAPFEADSGSREDSEVVEEEGSSPAV